MGRVKQPPHDCICEDTIDFNEYEAKEPHVFIQYKGTNLCADIHCECGAHLHVDEDFVYSVICPYCKQKWALDCHIRLHKVDPNCTAHPIDKLLEKDDDNKLEDILDELDANR